MKKIIPAILAALLLTATLQAQTANRAAKPNILFLFADDVRADAIAAHGNPHVKTPHAERGILQTTNRCTSNLNPRHLFPPPRA